MADIKKQQELAAELSSKLWAMANGSLRVQKLYPWSALL